MSKVRGPKDANERERLMNYIASGGGVSLEEVLEGILEESVDELLLTAIRISLEQAIIENRTINIRELLEQYLEWQEGQV